MRIVRRPRSFYYASKLGPIQLSAKAHERLRWLKAWQRLRGRGFSAGEAAEILKVPRSTLYRWQQRVEAKGLRGLEDGDRRPMRTRGRTWSVELVLAVQRVREQYPRWGKDKLVVLLEREGWHTSASTVGRILSYLKRRGALRQPPRPGISARKRRPRRPHAVRKPRSYPVSQPGDLVQVDTLDVRPLPDVRFKQFTARDMVSRWDVVEAHHRATAQNARAFLDTLLERTPFPVRAIQVDGGSEFHADFEQACAEKELPLFVLPPRSPKLNGHVERAQRTHSEEFHDLYLGDLDLKSVNQALQEWERTYNTVRPHQSLDMLTPAEYLRENYPSGPAPPSHLSHLCPFFGYMS